MTIPYVGRLNDDAEDVISLETKHRQISNKVIYERNDIMTKPLNILITGAISGFGRQTAETLAKDGHHVYASARGVMGKNADAAQSLEQWASEMNLNLKVVELDVSDEQSVNQGIATILEEAALRRGAPTRRGLPGRRRTYASPRL